MRGKKVKLRNFVSFFRLRRESADEKERLKKKLRKHLKFQQYPVKNGAKIPAHLIDLNFFLCYIILCIFDARRRSVAENHMGRSPKISE